MARAQGHSQAETLVGDLAQGLPPRGLPGIWAQEAKNSNIHLASAPWVGV